MLFSNFTSRIAKITFLIFLTGLFACGNSASFNPNDNGYELSKERSSGGLGNYAMENEVATETDSDGVGFKNIFGSNQGNNGTPQTPVERKLITTGSIAFETDSLTQAIQQIKKSVDATGAYISNENEVKRTNRIEVNFTIRVPSENFDELLNSATQGVSELTRKEIGVQDVSEEFYDQSARVASKQALEKRYLELLKEAKNVKEMLEVEREIGHLRTEIESIQGRLNYLQSQVSFSTLNIAVTHYVDEKAKEGESKLAKAFINGWNSLLIFLIGLVRIWPFLLILAGVVWGIRLMLRKRKRASN